MIKLINLDIDGKSKPTDIAMRTNNEYEIYYRLSKDTYDIDYSKFNNMRLNIRINKTSNVDYVILDTSNVVELNGKKYVVWKIPNVYLKDEALLIVNYEIKYDNVNHNIKSSNYQVYIKPTPEMNGILSAIDRYNTALGLYLDSIKRKEINSPNGIVGLDDNGVIEKDRFNPLFSEHIPTKLIDTLGKVENIHGLKLKNDDYYLYYYDNDDLEYYIVNQIHGGQLGYNNKPEQYNIFGGELTENSNFIDASMFNINLNDDIEGGNLNSSPEGIIDAGLFDVMYDENEDRYLNRIHGGFL